MTLHTQFITMISMVVSGIYLGLATDTFRRLVHPFKSKVYLKYLFEISYWVTQTMIIFYILYNVNHGELRFYIFLACLLGFSMYMALFQTTYKKLLEFLIKVIKVTVKGIIQAINTLIVQPIRWIIELIITILLSLLNLCKHIVLFLLKIFIYPFKVLFSLILRIIPEKILNKVSNLLTFCSTIINKFTRRIKDFLKRR